MLYSTVAEGISPVRGLKLQIEADRPRLTIQVAEGISPVRGLKPNLPTVLRLLLSVAEGISPVRGLKHGTRRAARFARAGCRGKKPG